MAPEKVQDEKEKKADKLQDLLGKLGTARKTSAPPPVFGAVRESKTRDYEHRTVELATLGGGCFWCIEAIFQQLLGVIKVESGYSGGAMQNPTYEDVCSDATGHAEVVQITFDPDIISYKQLLNIFFTVHDPTTPDRQGGDVGAQYRSMIFYRDEKQKREAQEVMKEITVEKIWDAPLVTQLVPFKAFYKAEDYHQNYYRNNPNQGYCRVVIAPKVKKFRDKYMALLKPEEK